MKWPTVIIICASLTAAVACDKRSENTAAFDGAALEQLYQADLTRANDGESGAMMRIGRYHDSGLSENDRCAGMLARC